MEDKDMKQFAEAVAGVFNALERKPWKLSPLCDNDFAYGFELVHADGRAVKCKRWGNKPNKLDVYGEYPKDSGGYDIAASSLLPVPTKTVSLVRMTSFVTIGQFLHEGFLPMYSKVFEECMKIREKQEQRQTTSTANADHFAKLLEGKSDGNKFEWFSEDEGIGQINGRVEEDYVTLKMTLSLDMATAVIRAIGDRIVPPKVFGSTSWCADDVKQKLEEYDLPTTDSNVDKVIEGCGKIVDPMIEAGWNYMDMVIGELHDELDAAPVRSVDCNTPSHGTGD